MNILDGCLLDELSDPSTIDDIDYYIAATGQLIVPTPTYTQLLARCQVDWTLVAINPNSGQEVALTATQA